jgi:hypothetical protein
MVSGSSGCIGVHRWGRWSLVGWVYGGLGLHLGVVGDGEDCTNGADFNFLFFHIPVLFNLI